MNSTSSSRPARANIALPATIWFAPTSGRPTSASPDATPESDAVVPGWALRRIRTEFTRRPGHDAPAPLFHLTLPDTSTNALPRQERLDSAPAQPTVPPVLLAELRPGAAYTLHGPRDDTGRDRRGMADSFYRAYRLLRRGGLLLTASRQTHREDGELIDPCGQLIAIARAAGFVYRQHILLIHATTSGNRLHPTPDAPPTQTGPFWRHQTIHSDLLLFTPA